MLLMDAPTPQVRNKVNGHSRTSLSIQKLFLSKFDQDTNIDISSKLIIIYIVPCVLFQYGLF